MKKTFIAIATMLAIVAGCTKNDPQAKVSDGLIRATIEDTDTKATLYGDSEIKKHYMIWEEDDAISLFDGASNIKCTLASEAGKKYGSFEPASTPAAAATYYAVYPYSADNALTEGALTVTYPSSIVFDATAGSAESGANIMVAKASSTDIKFKNLCGYIVFQITGESGQKISKVLIQGADNQAIAGPATVTFEGEVPSVAISAESTINTVTVSFGEDGLDLASPQSFGVAVAPVFSNGFKATICLADGSYQEKVSSTTIARNEIVTMESFAFSAKDVAEINGTPYKTLAAAVEAANAAESDVTIKMIANAFANADTIKNTNCVTLDLNGCVITGNMVVDSLASFRMTDGVGGGCLKNEKNSLKVLGCATFVMDGGMIEGTSSYAGSSAAPLLVMGGTTESVTKTNISLNAGKLIGKTNYGSVYARYSTVTIKDGFEIEGDRCIFAANESNYIINGGKFTGRHCIHYAHKTGVITINGGEFTATDAIANFSVASGNHIVLGGYFDAPLAASGQYVANVKITGGYYTFEPDNVLSGYEAKELAEPIEYKGKTYTHTIDVSKKTVARLAIEGKDDQEFTTIEAALAQAKSEGGSSTLYLLDSVTMAEAVALDCAIDLTLDLNSFTLDVTANRIDLTNADANFTIKNSGSTGEYRMALTGQTYGIKVTNGSLTIQNGFFRNNGSVAMIDVAAGGKVTINGGRIESLNADGKGMRTAGNTVINGGTIISGNYAIWAQGGETNIHGGEIISNKAHSLYISTGASKVNIDGGSFVAKTDGKYVISTTGKGFAHVINITKTETTEPVFYNTFSTEGDNYNRAIFNGYTVSKIYTSAGYFASQNLGKSSSPDTYVKSGYKREILESPIPREIDGVEYTFIMRVVPNEE